MITGVNSDRRGAAVVPVFRGDIATALEAAVKRWKPEILDLSHAIHADPELGGNEFRAAKRVRRVLRMAGFGFGEESCFAGGEDSFGSTGGRQRTGQGDGGGGLRALQGDGE